MTQNIGLVLMGGGLAGCYQVGLPLETWKRNLIPKKIQGVSVGALNAAKLVENGPEDMRKRWLEIENAGPGVIFSGSLWWRLFKRHETYFSDDGLEKLVRGLDMQKVLCSNIELQVVVRNRQRDRNEIFSNRDPAMINHPEDFRQIIKASACLRGFFPPVAINGQIYSDPYYMKLEQLADCDTIFMLLNDQITVEGHEKEEALRRRIFKEMFGNFSDVLDDDIRLRIQLFLQKHPEFCEFQFDSPLGFVEKVKNFIKKSVAELKQAFGADAKKRLIILSPYYTIPTLSLDTFKKGDITASITHSIEQARKVLDDLKL